MRHPYRRRIPRLPPHLLHCVCPPGLLRFETTRPLNVGVYCPACLLTTLRDVSEIDRFLDLYEDDDALRTAVIRSLHIEERRHEVNAGLEAPRPSQELESIPYDVTEDGESHVHSIPEDQTQSPR